MHIALIKDFTGLSYYGDIPDIQESQSTQAEFYNLSNENVELFLTFVDDLDSFCDALLDNGDVDYFSGEKLLKLQYWINNTMAVSSDDKLIDLLKILNSFVERAIKLNTGVVIEL